MSRITEMWQQGELPGWSGLYRADDTARTIDIDGAALTRYQVGEPFDLGRRLDEEPDEETTIDESARALLPDGGHVLSGEGAYGNEGFFARLDPVGGLVWVAYLRNGNPFYEIAVDWPRVTFTNNLGNGVTVDLTDELYV